MKKEKLMMISSYYVSPEHDAVEKYIHNKTKSNELPPLTMSSPKTEKNHSKPLDIVHESVLYPSLKTSFKVLKRNQSTYNKFMNILNKAEKDSINCTYRSIMEHKSKLEYYRHHCKKVLPNGNLQSKI